MNPATIYTSRQLRNDERNLKAIADGYETKLSHKYWLAEALQKDAIQNGWDAKHGKEWSMRFELRGKQDDFLAIQDFHTSGLNGTIWKDQGELASLLEGGDRTENLAHFLSSDFSTKTAESGGKRGRGKSLFLFASKNLIFYFDSKREATGDYVAGALFIDSDKGTKVEMVSGDAAVRYMKEKLGECYSSFDASGTRIFIKNPKEELIAAICDGSMMNYIEKNWWEIIKKYDARIVVCDGAEARQAQVPAWYREDQCREKGLETKEYPNLKLSSGDSKYRIKRVFLVYNPLGDTPESLAGISIQRKGMSIERRPTEALVKEDGMSKVYGWVEMEPELEHAMYDLEDVEHLGFIWTKKPAKDLLDLIKIQVRDFAKEVKLIESELSKERKAHKQIEDDIAQKVNNFLKNIGFSGLALTRRKRKGGTRAAEAAVRISLTDFKLPSEGRRVNYGEVLNAVATAVNELDIPLRGIHRTWVTDESGKVIRIKEEIVDLRENAARPQGWERMKVEKGEFSVGDYSFKSKFTLLEDTGRELPRIGKLEKGKEITTSTAFSVEKDPKAQGFIKFEPIIDKNRERYITTRPEAGVLVVEYNTGHPYISNLMPADRAADLRRFLLETGIIVAFNEVMAEDISSNKPKIFADIGEDYDATKILPRIMEEVSKFMWQYQ